MERAPAVPCPWLSCEESGGGFGTQGLGAPRVCAASPVCGAASCSLFTSGPAGPRWREVLPAGPGPASPPWLNRKQIWRTHRVFQSSCLLPWWRRLRVGPCSKPCSLQDSAAPSGQRCCLPACWLTGGERIRGRKAAKCSVNSPVHTMSPLFTAGWPFL